MNFKKARELLHLTIIEVVNNTGLSRTAVNNIEAGLTKKANKKLVEYFEKQGINKVWLLTGEGVPLGVDFENKTTTNGAVFSNEEKLKAEIDFWKKKYYELLEKLAEPELNRLSGKKSPGKAQYESF